MAHEIRNALGAAKLRLNDILTSGKVDKNYEKLANILETVKKMQGIPEDSLKTLIQAIRTLHDNQKAFEKTFTEVAVSTERGLQITNRVMEYSRLHLDKAEEEVDLRKIIEELVSTYGESLNRAGIQLEVSMADGLVVQGSNSRLHSVFQNLLLNARDAVLEKGEGSGRIHIRGEARENDVVMEVKDTGAGIPEEDIERIFYPFFSTKPSTGMGLGLSECQKIVKQYGGRIEVENTADKGAVFRVFLPKSLSFGLKLSR
jgi:signal transduction histidine kinase